MNCSDVGTLPALDRPLTDRLAAGVDAMLAALRGSWTAGRARIEPLPDRARAYASIAHLSEHMLKDIGAPEWLAAHAAQEREARRFRAIEREFR
jgi:hypothetical protein